MVPMAEQRALRRVTRTVTRCLVVLDSTVRPGAAFPARAEKLLALARQDPHRATT